MQTRGMNESQSDSIKHAYTLPPIGRLLWRKVVRDGPMQGVKAGPACRVDRRCQNATSLHARVLTLAGRMRESFSPLAVSFVD
jgi:hypothetical protein